MYYVIHIFNPMNTAQLIIRLPAEEKFEFQLLAETLNTSLSDVARKALKLFAKTQTKTKPDDELMTLINIGKKYRGPKPPSDLSSNYKKYLYGDKSIKFGKYHK